MKGRESEAFSSLCCWWKAEKSMGELAELFCSVLELVAWGMEKRKPEESGFVDCVFALGLTAIICWGIIHVIVWLT
jgi:hypothetical protein